MGWLSLRPHTAAELTRKLARRQVPEEVAEAVLGRFAEVGLVDDRAFAAAWVDSRHGGRGLARRALAHELRQRGVEGAVVAEALAELAPETELATARRLVQRRLAGLAGLPREAQVRRLVGLLARKGYGAGTAARVVREALEAVGPGTEAEQQALLALDSSQGDG